MKKNITHRYRRTQRVCGITVTVYHNLDKKTLDAIFAEVKRRRAYAR